MPIRNWRTAMSRFIIEFKDIIVKHITKLQLHNLLHLHKSSYKH
jgi:hypothetical protein